MRKMLFAVASIGAAAVAGPIPSRAPAAVPNVRTVYGHWQVVSVAVADSGVQSLALNDPSYMGRRLTFTHDRLVWDEPKQTSTERPCVAPTIRPTKRDGDPDARATVRKVGGPASGAFSINCRGGAWGPAAPPSPAILAFRDGSIALWWFDNGLLKLRRIS